MSRKMTTDEFIAKAIKVHGDSYSYLKTQYIGCFDYVTIFCNICLNDFTQIASLHLYGQGCNKCRFIRGGQNKRYSTIEFIEMARKIHGDKYDYKKSIYTLIKEKLIIICNACGFEFPQTPDNHLSGKGCPKCADKVKAKFKRKPASKFIQESIGIHHDRYDYSLVNDDTYTNKDKNIPIKCIACNYVFWQTPGNHLAGNGCPKCANSSISKKEIEWLNQLEIPEECRQKTLIVDEKKYRVDAYVEATNTIYEFYGDYWHGNPKIFKQEDINKSNNKMFRLLYDNTIKRETIIKQAGYNLITIWEMDWKNGKAK